MKEIFCPITMFALKQKIYRVDTETEEVAVELEEIETDFLPWALLDLCEKEQSEKIHLAGVEDYVQCIAENVKEYQTLKYSNKKEIEIEVN